MVSKEGRPEDSITMLRRHCAMYAYWSSASNSPLLSDVGTDFVAFAGMHLICTMFIITDDSRDPGGAFHRVLDPMGFGHLLDDVDRILSTPVGGITVGQFLRSKRNKLAVHGSLDFSSQPQTVQDVTFDDVALEQFDDAIYELDMAVLALGKALADLQ